MRHIPHNALLDHGSHARRGGFILVMVLVVCLMSAMVAAGLLYRMTAESAAAAGANYGEQAHAAAMSGIQLALSVLTPVENPNAASDGSSPAKLPPDMTVWYDNRELFRNRLVADDGANKWYFTIYAPHDVQPEEVRYGLIDEAGKINITSPRREILLRIPGMTEELADTFLDYIDRDSETLENGAEQDYYDALPHPYAIKNAPLLRIEESLLIKGFTGGIVYGEDANLNGLLDPNENDGDERFPPDDGDGVLNTGLLGLTTLVSAGPDLDAQGQARVNINSANEQAMTEAGLSSATIEFIMDVRNDGGSISHPSQLLGMKHTIKGQSPQGGRGGRRGRGNRDDSPKYPAGTELSSPVDDNDLKILMARFGSGAQNPVGLINIYSAPAPALALLPEIDAGVARQIVDTRSTLDAEEKAGTAWLYTRGLLDADQFKTVAPRLTIRGYQYRVRCVGFGVPVGRYKILEALIDTATGAPIIVYLRDISRVGAPFALDPDKEEF